MSRIDEELGELEKEKMMRELEVKELTAHHRAEIRNIEMQMSALKVSGYTPKRDTNNIYVCVMHCI